MIDNSFEYESKSTAYQAVLKLRRDLILAETPRYLAAG